MVFFSQSGPSGTESLNPIPAPTAQNGIQDLILGNNDYTNPTAVNCEQRQTTPTPDTACDEAHLLPTRYNEQILAGSLTFAGAGSLLLFKANGNTQFFEIDFQPSAGVSLQLLEGQNPGTAISGNWNLAANQVWTWGGRYSNQSLFLQASGACVVQFEIRFRSYGAS